MAENILHRLYSESSDNISIEEPENLLEGNRAYELHTTLLNDGDHKVRFYHLYMKVAAEGRDMVHLAKVFNEHYSACGTSLNCLLYDAAGGEGKKANLPSIAVAASKEKGVRNFFLTILNLKESDKKFIVYLTSSAQTVETNFFQKLLMYMQVIKKITPLKTIDRSSSAKEIYSQILLES